MKTALPLRRLATLALASLLATGCIVVDDTNPQGFAPFGNQVTVSGNWTVSGAPATAQSCGTIATVRALVCENASGTNCLANTALTFSCAAGSFDSRPSALLMSGSYYVVWEGLGSNGGLIQSSSPTRFDAFGSHVALPIPNFTATTFNPAGNDVSLAGTWLVNGTTPTAQSCGDIHRVRVVVCRDALGSDCWTTPSLSFACSLGSFDTRPTRVLAAGAYHSLWEALDVNGNVIQETSPLPLVVTLNQHAGLASPDFQGVLPPTSVTVQVRFQQELGSSSYLTCSAAQIGSNQFTYRLHEGASVTDPTIAGPTTQSCGSGSDVVFTETSNFHFDGDPYTLHVTASENVSGCVTTWDAKCTFQLTLHQANTLVCNAQISSSTGAGCN